MAKYQVNEVPVATLTSDQIRSEAADLRHQITCVSTDIASKRAWADADGKIEGNEYKVWMAKARSFWGKLQKRYSEIRRAERKLNRAEYTSKRHVSRGEFETLKNNITEKSK
ncbi:MAG: hypothetical protein WC869_00980 [Phycisphaerae bacterium]|jgi:hypothetical protein